MKNHYLEITTEDGMVDISSSDGVFNASARRKDVEGFKQYCQEKADEWLNSSLGNYTCWSKEDRQTIANKWLAAKELPQGKYNYYFNLKSKRDLFSEAVAELAKELDVEYELTIK